MLQIYKTFILRNLYLDYIQLLNNKSLTTMKNTIKKWSETELFTLQKVQNFSINLCANSPFQI